MARIDHYEFGRIVVDGREETRDLIILPDRVVRNWWRQHGHALVLDDLVEILDELPPHLVVGTKPRSGPSATGGIPSAREVCWTALGNATRDERIPAR